MITATDNRSNVLVLAVQSVLASTFEDWVPYCIVHGGGCSVGHSEK